MFGKILIIDGKSEISKVLKDVLEAEFYDIITSNIKTNIFDLIDEDRPDLIILDETSNTINIFDICEDLKNNPETFYLPIMAIANTDEGEEKAKIIEAGVDEIIKTPIDNMALFARINSLLRLKMMAEQWIIRETALQDNTVTPNHLDLYFGKMCKYSNILVIGGSDEEIHTLKMPLIKQKYKIIYTKNLDDASTLSEFKKIDLFIISLSIGKKEALKLSSKIRSHEKSKSVPILIVGEEKDKSVFPKALEIGCNDYITIPFDNHEYLARTHTQLKKNKYRRQLEKNYQKSLSLASIDDLTGVSNRRYLHSYLDSTFTDLKNSDKKLAMFMIDIDYFKQINDTYGHLIGDEILIEFSNRLKSKFRDFDLISRYGGDEFIAIVPYIEEKLAEEIAERIRKTICEDSFKISISPYKLRIEISVGVTIVKDFERSPDDIIEEADEALYEAKKQGRNKVCMFV